MNKPWPHGSAVVNGEVRFLSVSQLSLASPDEGGCLRKWWYQYPGKRKPPPSKSQERGVRGHAEVERYLKTGVKAFGSMVMSGLHFIPDPGDDLLIEHDILGPTLDAAPLRAAGIPVLGQLDLAHGRCVNKGADSVDDMNDPPNTVEVCDWKFMGDDRFLKQPHELVKTAQMAGYGVWATQVIPDTELLRLSHGYFVERGRSRKVTTRVPRMVVEKSWEQTEGVARSIKHAAKASSAEQVDANTRACASYGGCFHRDVCSAAKHNSLASLIGPAAASQVLNPSSQGVISPMSLLSRLNAAPAAAPTAPATGSLLGNRAAAPDPAVAAARAKLEAEEKAARLKALIPPGFEALCAEIESYNRGFPALIGAAAAARAAMLGFTLEGDGLAGSGELGGAQLADPAQFPEVLKEMEERWPKSGGTPATMGLLPPDAPESDPATASAGPVDVAQEVQPMSGTPASAIAAVVAEKPKRGRPPKAAAAPAPVAVVAEAPAPAPTNLAATVAAATPVTRTEPPVRATPTNTAITIYVDCIPSVQYTDLAGQIDKWCAELAKQCGADDLRYAPSKDSPLAYGGWKGVLAAYGRESTLAPGNYFIDTRGSDIAEVLAEALRSKALASGGFVVRGLR